MAYLALSSSSRTVRARPSMVLAWASAVVHASASSPTGTWSRPNHDAVAFGQLESSSTGSVPRPQACSKSTRSPLEDDEIAQSRQLQNCLRSESLPILQRIGYSTNAHGL